MKSCCTHELTRAIFVLEGVFMLLSMKWRFVKNFIAHLYLALTCVCVSVFAQEAPLAFRTEPGIFDAAEAHVQGICCDENAVYVVFKNYVYKLDWSGKILKSVEAPIHAGDPCLADNKLIIAMSTSDDYAALEYDLDLNLLREIKLKNGSGTDGVALLDGIFYFGGPSLHERHTRNRLLVYDRKFNFVKEVWLDFDIPTSWGFQSITSSESHGLLFAAFYPDNKAAPANPPRSIWFDKDYNIIGTTRLDGSNGWSVAPPSRQPGGNLLRFLVARTEKIDGKVVAAMYWYDFDGKDFHPAMIEK